MKTFDGKQTFSSSKEKIRRWKEHFATAASSDSTVDTTAYSELLLSSITLYAEVVAELSKPPSIVELTNALKQCKLETAPGINGISSNMLKIGANETVYWLKVISEQIWKIETIPHDWKNQIIIPIHKHGTRSLCENYRRIALLCVASKTFGRAMLNRIRNVIENQLGESQCGFKPNRGCCDQIFATKILMQRARVQKAHSSLLH